ncbi:MAG TPA: hypothetical protein VMS64_41155, partial [Candidatus Methylomirabilis sp.]|nr:hypothetical protein [Candidatus Methylomirabilis sp.]
MTRASLLGTVPIVVAMNMIYATPHGLALLRVPFTPTGPASRYINEFRLVQMEELLGFNISPDTWAPTYQTMFNLVALAACLAALASLWRWRLRLSHLLLFAGGVVLLTKGARFRYEFVLLALPLIAANPLLPSPAAIPTRRSRAILGLVTAVSLVMSISAAAQWFVNRPKYPLSPARLPTGVVTFLNQVGGGGRVLNQPNTGGYLQWMLYPRYKIFMDMEVPFLFTDEDMVVATNMFGDRQVLASVLDRYQPDFITVPISTVDFKQLIEAFPDYDAVFLDDTEVLYVNAAKHPEIARASALRGIDPFTLLGSSADKLLREKDTVGPALRRLVAIDPSGGGANLALGTLDKEEGELTAALQHAEVVIEEYPESPEGYRLKAAVLRAQNRLGDSVRWYREALARAGGARKLAIQRELGVVYTELGLHEEGYRLLRDSLSVFDATTSYRDIFDLGVAALKAGRVREAALIFRLGAAKVPAGDKEWQDKYRQQNAALGDRVAR